MILCFFFNGVIRDIPIGDKLLIFNKNTRNYVSRAGENILHRYILGNDHLILMGCLALFGNKNSDFENAEKKICPLLKENK